MDSAVMDNVKEAWQMWDEAVAGAVFGGFETLFGEDIRSSPCPHTVDLFAVRTPTILVTWALAYLAIVFVGLLKRSEHIVTTAML